VATKELAKLAASKLAFAAELNEHATSTLAPFRLWPGPHWRFERDWDVAPGFGLAACHFTGERGRVKVEDESLGLVHRADYDTKKRGCNSKSGAEVAQWL
jgi:hypothetical protein